MQLVLGHGVKPRATCVSLETSPADNAYASATARRAPIVSAAS